MNAPKILRISGRSPDEEMADRFRDWMISVLRRIVEGAEWLPGRTVAESRKFRADCLAASRWALGFAEWYLQPGRLQALCAEDLAKLEESAWQLWGLIDWLVHETQRRHRLREAGLEPDLVSTTVH